MNYIIYKIFKPDCDFIYIGSTTQFVRRKAQHKYNSIHNLNMKLYKIIRENGGWRCWNMLIIEEIKDCNRTEAQTIEQKYIDELEANLNMNGAIVNIDKKKAYQKIYNKKYYENKKIDIK